MNIQFYQILSNWWPLKECFVINSKFISTYLFIIIYSSITFFSIYLLLFLDESFSHLLLELLFLLPNNTMNLKKNPNNMDGELWDWGVFYLCRWNSWNHFQCNIDEKVIKETGRFTTQMQYSPSNVNQCCLFSLF